MSYWNSKVLCIAVVSGIALGSVSQARAQAPANDICANATLITDSTAVQTISYNTTNAAYEGAPAPCGCTSSRDVWFRYVPTTSGTVSISTQGLATWDTSIIVYSGTCFSLTNVACNDDTGGLQSVVTPTVVAGTSYLIRLSGCGSGSSAIRFTGPTTILPADTTAVTFQGQLKDDTGTPLNGTFNLQCLVMNNRAGTVLGSIIGNFVLENGLFTTSINVPQVNANDQLAFRVFVNGTRLSPDFPINRGLQAKFADTARVAQAPWVISGTEISYTGGNVGIGVADPTVPLHVVSGGGVALSSPRVIFGAPGSAQMRFDDNEVQTVNSAGSAATMFLNYGGGEVWMGGQAVNNSGLTLNGPAVKPGGGTWGVLSDMRLKHDVEPMHGTLEKLLELRGVSYVYNNPEEIGETDGTKLGMVAQEVEAVFPQWVQTNKNGYKFISFTGFEALTVEALRDLRKEKDAAVTKLQEENKELRERLEKLEKALEGK